MTTYLRATRHPWPTMWLLLPLLLAYEVGIIWLGGSNAQALRNGADSWLRWGLEAFGLNQLIVAPALVAVAFIVWSWLRKDDRPAGAFTICCGMILECFLFALSLWGVSHGFGPFLESIGVPLSTNPNVEHTVSRVITFVGAGVYEEIVFRLVLFSGLACVLRLALLPRWSAVLLAATASSLLFAGAHHIGPYGEAMNSYVFLFRSLAGIYFALIYQLRGFAVAAGAHACYDVLVGLT
jgi:hypothetical protein